MMDDNRLDRMKALMEEQQLDALVAITPENVLYTTGSYIATQKHIRDRLAISVFTQERAPVFIVCGIEESLAKEESWIEDVRTYIEFQASPIDLLVDVLKEWHLENGMVGMELNYLSVKY